MLLLNTDDDLWLLDYDFSWFADNQMIFADYDQNDDELSGYLYFTCDLSLKDTVRLKFLETFDEHAFEEQIASLGDIRFSESKL